jgi:CrcB protein
MTYALLVGVGGFLGAILRYLVSGFVYQALHEPLFPYGTLFVNALGCAFLGLAAGVAEGRGLLSAEARVFLFIGFLGSFTTFSTFGYETLRLAKDGEFLLALGNVGGQVILGLGGVWAGDALAKLII